jgi:hypothetical protein
MYNSNNTQALSCPICKLTQDGYTPVIEVICNHCIKEFDYEQSK